MTDNRLRALIIGGDDRILTDHLLEWVNPTHVDNETKKLPTSANDVKVVVIITRWVSHSMFDKARTFAKGLGIPLLQAHTGNYVIHELVKGKHLPEDATSKNGKKKPEPAPEPAKPEPDPEPVKEPEPVTVQQTGLKPDEVWELYGSKAIETVKGALKPGEKIHENDLIELFSMPDGGVGLPKESAVHLLPELAVLGLIINVKGKTWLVPNLDIDYDYKTLEPAEAQPEADHEEVEPMLAGEVSEKIEKGRKDRAESKLKWVELLGGLHPGPYASQKAIWEEALKYSEFSRGDNGQPLVMEYYWHIIPIAIEYGVVERLRDGSYVVVPDEKVKLTLRDASVQVPEEDEKRDKRRKKRVVVEEPVEEPVAEEPEPEPEPVKETPKRKPKTESSNPVVIVRNHYGGTIPVLDRFAASTKTLKRLIPTRYWYEAAAQTIARITKVRDREQCEALRESFDEVEWDRLAFDTIRQLPIETILPFLKEMPQDMHLQCVDCGSKFMFTVSEQEFIKRMVEKGEFESYEVPKRCAECRKKARASRL